MASIKSLGENKGGLRMKMEGYKGICAGCFEPIRDGQGYKFRENGRSFHKRCVESNPNGYYIKFEEIAARFETASKEELPRLMTELTQAYTIPMTDNEVFSRNKDLVRLIYHRVGSAENDKKGDEV